MLVKQCQSVAVYKKMLLYWYSTLILRMVTMGLSEKFGSQDIKADVVADCVKLMDEQVAAKTGFSGVALKAAYGIVKGVGPSYIPGAIHWLLPEAVAALDPMWEEGEKLGDPVQYLSQNRSRTADLLLGITDAKIKNSKNEVVRVSYNKLRKSVKSDVEEAVPGLAKILATHTQG
jgi:hypothetical protein